MGYAHINNLYKDQTILMFKECYALEKIHGTSAHLQIGWNTVVNQDWGIKFFSGGEKHERFVALFDQAAILAKVREHFQNYQIVTIFGEAYGGKQQGMSDTYGKELKFVAFDVNIFNGNKLEGPHSHWLSVPDAKDVAVRLGLDFVHFVKIPTTLEAIDKERDAHSIQAVKNGITTLEAPDLSHSPVIVHNPKIREGVVLRPPVEVTLNNGSRIVAKHKRAEFKETATERKVIDPAQQKVLDDADAVANEWVTVERLKHVLDKIPDHGMEKMPQILAAMVEDVLREGKGEIVESKAVNKAISKKTALMYKESLVAAFKETCR